MNYELKMLNENYKNSEDINTLNYACEYYKTMIYCLKAMSGTEDNHIFFRLLNVCYKLQKAEKDDSDTMTSAISLITESYLKQKDNQKDKFEQFLNKIRTNIFSEERLKSDLDCASKTLHQYYLILKSVIEDNIANKKLMK